MRVFAWMNVLLSALVLAGCQPGFLVTREEAASDGSGGPGGSTRSR